MAIINAGYRFRARKKKSLPIVKIPKNVKEAFNIDTMYKNGIAKLEPGKKNCLYDRCYVFEEVNYINKDDAEKESFLNQFMAWLKTMNVDFKITVANEYQSIEEFLDSVRCMTNRSLYPEISKGIDRWTMEKLEDSNPNVTTLRYLTISCRAASLQDARIVFNALDTNIQSAFAAWQARIIPLDAAERLSCIHSLLCPGKKRDEEFITYDSGHNWKNDIFPQSIRTYSNFMVTDEDTYMAVLFGWKYRGSIDPDSFIRSFSNMEFPSYITMDFAPVPPDEISDFLTAAGMNVEKSISDEEEYKRRKNIIGTGPSYARQRKKDEVEGLQDQIAENDETGFYMNLLMVVTAPDEDILAQRVSKYKAIGRKEGVVMDTANWQQLKALNTALPIGGRQVDFMRFFLSSSVAAFQPFYAQDIIEAGGYMYGLNRATKRLILGNRKLLMNPHGIIIGHTGSGKSFYIKYTEIMQTLIGTDDDILVLDPQNEFLGIVKRYGGAFFDLTPKSGIYLNGFEIYEDVFYGDSEERERFIAIQTKYAKSLVAAIMSNILFTQEHASVVGRCTRRMYDKAFAQKKLKKQPTLKMLREEIRKELMTAKTEYDENIIRPIYNSMEEYTEGACDMLARPSNVRFDERLVGFGLKNVPEDNWEAVMLTIMHYTSSRMEFNQKERRAVHFIVDETQVLSRKGTSADQLNTAVATFRKFGGICTMAMQNLTAALHNEQLKELFSNCSYKCFLDQGGVDANALAEIQELSQTEFDALSSDEPGRGVMVWGKKVVLFDAKVSKDNPLYDMISTNFYEKKGDDRQPDFEGLHDSTGDTETGTEESDRTADGLGEIEAENDGLDTSSGCFEEIEKTDVESDGLDTSSGQLEGIEKTVSETDKSNKSLRDPEGNDDSGKTEGNPYETGPGITGMTGQDPDSFININDEELFKSTDIQAEEMRRTEKNNGKEDGKGPGFRSRQEQEEPEKGSWPRQTESERFLPNLSGQSLDTEFMELSEDDRKETSGSGQESGEIYTATEQDRSEGTAGSGQKKRKVFQKTGYHFAEEDAVKRAAEGRPSVVSYQPGIPKHNITLDLTEKIILRMASFTDVGINDILYILDQLTEETVRGKAGRLVSAGLLHEAESPVGLRYRKAG